MIFSESKIKKKLSQGLQVKRNSENSVFPPPQLGYPVEKCALALFLEMKRNSCDVTIQKESSPNSQHVPN